VLNVFIVLSSKSHDFMYMYGSYVLWWQFNGNLVLD